jgi:hypothetical protein
MHAFVGLDRRFSFQLPAAMVSGGPIPANVTQYFADQGLGGRPIRSFQIDFVETGRFGSHRDRASHSLEAVSSVLVEIEAVPPGTAAFVAVYPDAPAPLVVVTHTDSAIRYRFTRPRLCAGQPLVVYIAMATGSLPSAIRCQVRAYAGSRNGRLLRHSHRRQLISV